MKETKSVKILYAISDIIMALGLAIGVGNYLSEYYAILITLILFVVGWTIGFITIMYVMFQEVRDLIKINKELQKNVCKTIDKK